MRQGKVLVMGMAGTALFGGAAWAAWMHWRPAPAPVVTTVYSWTDAQGVVHFDQRPGQGRPLAIDTRRITPLVKPPQQWADRVPPPVPAAPPGGVDGNPPDTRTISQQMVDRAVDASTQ